MFKKVFGVKHGRNKEIENTEADIGIRDRDYYKISLELSSDIVNIMTQQLDPTNLHIDDIPEKKINNVSNIYNIDKNKIVALYDTTVFKSGKDGILLGNDFMGIKHPFEQPNTIKFDELVISRISKDEKYIEINNNIIELKSDEYTNLFIKIKEDLILKDTYLQSIYAKYIINKLHYIEANIDINIEGSKKDFLILEETILNNDTNYYAALYNYGCIINMKQSNFKDAYKYLYNLEQLNEWDKVSILELRDTLDKNKIRYEFNILEKRKNVLLQQNKYDEAVSIVKEEEKFNIKSNEELLREIDKIKDMKETYINLLEDNIVVNLNNKKYEEVLDILKELGKINKGKCYEEYYLTAKTGIYKFEEVEFRINKLKETNQILAFRLEENLITHKEYVSKTIKKAVQDKNYTVFEEDKNLRYAKDEWGMSALMHFILKKDIEGVRKLSDTYEYFNMYTIDKNIMGHSTLSLLALDLEDSFWIEVLEILDKDFKALKKRYKVKSSMSKFGKIAISSVDELNSRTLDNISIKDTTVNAESVIDKSLNEAKDEIERYISKKILEYYSEFIDNLVNQYDFQSCLQDEIEIRNDILAELIILKNQKYELDNPVDIQSNLIKNNKIEEILQEAAVIEIGEKDEFETTNEYKRRIDLKIENLRQSYKENKYIIDKISKYRSIVEKEIREKTNHYKEIQAYIYELYYLLNCEAEIDRNKVISYYYDIYKGNIEIGIYDADTEIFTINANKIENKVKVSRKIAKDFKDKFETLEAIYTREIVEEEEEIKIKHYFIYEYEYENIKVLFLENIV